ncbi:MAG: hypothetical protein CMN66_03615, partial [Sphingomonadaceae bacterium]|nr:hypothetical protein [Sphingomonadaceae bacterium]
MKHLLALAALALAATPLAAAEPIEGRWVTEDRDAIVQIGACGRSICGRIAKLLVTPPQGADQRDVNNRDAAKRSRKLLGMAILTGFTEDEDSWR